MNISGVLDNIKPRKRGESDKFSWNIYRYLRDNNRSDIKVYFYQEKKVDGTLFEFDPNKTLFSGMTYIMRGNSWIGTRIANIMQSGERQHITDYSFCLFDKERFIDITEWFFKEYQAVGRCIFDRNHNGWFIGDDGRFTQINRNSRKCKWCGEHQRRQITKDVSIKRREKWVS